MMKRNAPYLLCITMLSIGLASCKKVSQQQTTISGHAINMTDNSGLSGYEVHLVEIETPTAPFTPLSSKLISSTITDQQGAFSFDERLRRRSRFEYFVQFDKQGEMFAPDNWQDGTYDKVQNEIKVEKGVHNQIRLTTVPNGEFQIEATNSSPIDDLLFEGFLANNHIENKSFYAQIRSGEAKRNESYYAFPAGELTLTWIISNDQFSDTVIQQYHLSHNERIDIEFTYE